MHYLYEHLWETPTEQGVKELLIKNNLAYHTDEIIKNCNNLTHGVLHTVPYLDDEEEAESNEAFEKSTTDIKEEEVSYILDRYGIRYTGTDILKDSVNSLIFGCSFTFGVGVPLEKTWSSIVNNSIPNNSYVNLAIPGSSISKITRLFYTSTQFKKPKRVFMLLPDYNREEVVVEGTEIKWEQQKGNFHIYDFVPRYLPENQEVLYYVKKYMSTLVLENNKITTYKNLQIIKLLSEVLNIDLYISSWCPWTYSMLVKVFDKSQIAPYFNFTNNITDNFYARDGGHPGLKDNEKFSNELLNFIK